jgi:hypothetical protein
LILINWIYFGRAASDRNRHNIDGDMHSSSALMEIMQLASWRLSYQLPRVADTFKLAWLWIKLS